MSKKSNWKPKSERICIDCGIKGIAERRRCKECAKEYNRQRMRKSHKEKGRHNYGQGICPICNKSMTLWLEDQVAHAKCRMNLSTFKKNQSEAQHGRYIANKLLIELGINKPKGYEIHHLDENPTNNDISNLILIHSTAHRSLHRHLQYHRSLFLKENSSNSGDCWNTLRDHLTTAWLETTSANVIKIDGIGQPAAETLSSITEYEEGSETRSESP